MAFDRGNRKLLLHRNVRAIADPFGIVKRAGQNEHTEKQSKGIISPIDLQWSNAFPIILLRQIEFVQIQ
jgi:hypothetical protein